jgi:hypothetical protein
LLSPAVLQNPVAKVERSFRPRTPDRSGSAKRLGSIDDSYIGPAGGPESGPLGNRSSLSRAAFTDSGGSLRAQRLPFGNFFLKSWAIPRIMGHSLSRREGERVSWECLFHRGFASTRSTRLENCPSLNPPTISSDESSSCAGPPNVRRTGARLNRQSIRRSLSDRVARGAARGTY